MSLDFPLRAIAYTSNLLSSDVLKLYKPLPSRARRKPQGLYFTPKVKLMQTVSATCPRYWRVMPARRFLNGEVQPEIAVLGFSKKTVKMAGFIITRFLRVYQVTWSRTLRLRMTTEENVDLSCYWLFCIWPAFALFLKFLWSPLLDRFVPPPSEAWLAGYYSLVGAANRRYGIKTSVPYYSY